MKINPRTLAKIANLDEGAELIVSSPKTNTLQRIPVDEFFSTEGVNPVLETVVDISSAEILAMGSTPIELLPAAGANKYYDIEKIVLEYTHVTTAYTFAGIITLFEQYSTAIDSALITGAGNRFSITKENSYPSDAVGYNYAVAKALNQSLTLTTDDGSSPTLGDGTIRVIISYTIRTFGE